MALERRSGSETLTVVKDIGIVDGCYEFTVEFEYEQVGDKAAALAIDVIYDAVVGLESSPYLYYHTHRDNPEWVSGKMMLKHTVIAGTFVQLPSSFDNESIPWLVGTIIPKWFTRLDEIRHDVSTATVTSREVKIGNKYSEIIRSREWAVVRMQLLSQAYSDALFGLRRVVPASLKKS
ncbi:MAG: hypothetical protein HXY34_02485 [Candidatus Thorarchaeota archaeon]|nr:hypothetical protein [Candidatus Thorarchaeota archaeon]